jgi:hypothetical protein
VPSAYKNSYSLLSLIDPDPKNNLAVQAPFIAYNSSQRVLAYVMSDQYDGIIDQFSFSLQIDLANGRITNSSPEHIAALNKIPKKMLEQNLNKTLLAKKALSNNPLYFKYYFHWKNLPDLKALEELNAEDLNETAVHENPIKLLPFEYQIEVADMVRKYSKPLIKMDPLPTLEPLCTRCEQIRQILLEYYSSKIGHRNLSPAEIVQILNQYVAIERVVE